MPTDHDGGFNRRTFLKATGVAGVTASFGGVASAACGDTTVTKTYDGTLSGPGDGDCLYYTNQLSSTCEYFLSVFPDSLSADVDLYVNEGLSNCPTTSSYDYADDDAGSSPSIVISNPDSWISGISILVYCESSEFNGPVDYRLTVEETSE